MPAWMRAIGRRLAGVLDPNPLGVDERQVVGERKRARLGMLVEPPFQVHEVLAPVHVAIAQVIVSAQWTARQFIKVREAVGTDREAANRRPGERAAAQYSDLPVPELNASG